MATTKITSVSATLVVERSEHSYLTNSSEICPVDQLELTSHIQESDFIPIFLSREQIEAKSSTKRVDASNELEMDQLPSGIFVCFVVAPIDACTNTTIRNRTLTSCAPIGNNDPYFAHFSK